jgi:hypothetical protein
MHELRRNREVFSLRRDGEERHHARAASAGRARYPLFGMRRGREVRPVQRLGGRNALTISTDRAVNARPRSRCRGGAEARRWRSLDP